jgi:hypothetical protein
MGVRAPGSPVRELPDLSCSGVPGRLSGVTARGARTGEDPHMHRVTERRSGGSLLRSSGKWIGRALLLSALAPVMIACAPRGYACGEETPLEKDSVRRCDGPDEVCICATHSCAVRTFDVPGAGADAGADAGSPSPAASSGDGACPDGRPRDDDKPCASGLRYLGSPFANEKWNGCCVDPAHATALIERDTANARCSGGGGGQGGAGGASSSSGSGSGGGASLSAGGGMGGGGGGASLSAGGGMGGGGGASAGAGGGMGGAGGAG